LISEVIVFNNDTKCELIALRYLTNSKADVENVIKIHNNQTYDIETNYNKKYDYCVSIFYKDNIINDQV